MIDVSSKSCTSERHGCIPGSTFGHLAFVKVLVEVVSVIKPDHGSHDLEISSFEISVSAAGHARMVNCLRSLQASEIAGVGDILAIIPEASAIPGGC